MVQHVINPKTGRKIQVGGPTYNKLKREGVRVGSLPKAKPQALSKTLKTIPKSRKRKIAKMEYSIAQSSGRGAKTRGWSGAAPQRGVERHRLMRECGSDCFLKPGTEGYPICAALRTGQGCAVDCRGLQAAKIRAHQSPRGSTRTPRIKSIYQRAMKLESKYKC